MSVSDPDPMSPADAGPPIPATDPASADEGGSNATPSERRADERRRERYGLLLIAIIAAFAIQGIATPSRPQQILVTVLLSVTLMLALWAGEVRPEFVRPISLISLVVIVSALATASATDVGHVPSRVANLLLVVLAPPAIVVGVVRSLQKHRAVTVEAVFGTLCIYLLLGMFFAFLYGTLGQTGPPLFANNAAPSVAHCLYFSFTTLTTVGYGDLTAKSNLGHTMSVFEALIGQIYLVTVVSVIVSNLALAQRATRGARAKP